MQPVYIILTATYLDGSIKKRAMEAGVDNVLSKPLELETLERLLKLAGIKYEKV